MIRAVIRLHTGILVLAAFALLMMPASILTAFGVADPTFPMFALTRVLAGLIVILAVAVTWVADLPAPTRFYALSLIGAAYGLMCALCFLQQLAIWSSIAGALLTAELLLHSAAFTWLAAVERRSSRLATNTR
jgi:hypothetical protein